MERLMSIVKKTIKKAIVSGLLAVTMLASAMAAAVPALADPPPPSNPPVMSLDNASVSAGAEFNVNLNLGSSVELRGWQAKVMFPADKLEVVPVGPYNVVHGNFFPGQAGQHGAIYSPGISIVNNTAGWVASYGNLEYSPGYGASGSGVLATIRFRVKPGVDNTTAALTIATSPTDPWRAILCDTQLNPNEIYPTVINSVVTIGTPPMVDLTVSNVTATAVSGNPSDYNISFRVNNIGTLNADQPSFASIVVDGGTPIVLQVPVINAGSYVTVTTTSPITITGTNDIFVITADSTNIFTESNENNNTASGSYSYVAPAGATTEVGGAIAGTLTFTQPEAVNFGTMQLGWNQVNRTLKVVSNQSWAVNVRGNAPTTGGGTDGKMTKWSSSSGYNPNVKLHNPLRLSTSGGYLGNPSDPGQTPPANYTVDLTGEDQLLCNGIPEGQHEDGVTGETREVAFKQRIVGSDAALASPYSYRIVVSFIASSTAW